MVDLKNPINLMYVWIYKTPLRDKLTQEAPLAYFYFGDMQFDNYFRCVPG